MGRTPSIALRLRGLVNWPSNVRHPFLASYVKHIFQNFEMAEPSIRASTTGIWINVTILRTGHSFDPMKHPKIINPVLEFRNVDLSTAMGRVESRIKLFTQGGIAREGTPRAKPVEGHTYFKEISKGSAGHLLGAKDMATDPMSALQIYKDKSIHMRVNVINNPLLNASCLAHYIAKYTQRNSGNFQKIYKQLIQSLN